MDIFQFNAGQVGPSGSTAAYSGVKINNTVAGESTSPYKALHITRTGTGTQEYRAIDAPTGIVSFGGTLGVGSSTTPSRTLHVTGDMRITTFVDTPTRVAGADADGDIGEITIGDNLALAGGTLSAPTRYALVTLDSTQHTLPFLSSSTAPDSVGNLQVTDIGGIFTISAGKKTIKYSGTAGYFLVNYATSFQGIEGIHLNHLWKNGTLIESSRTRTEVTTTPLSVAGVTVVQLTAGDELQFGYTPDNHAGNNNIITQFLTITISRI